MAQGKVEICGCRYSKASDPEMKRRRNFVCAY